jgi:large subunit ribosomal protein L30
MAKVKIKQVRSRIHSTARQKKTLSALGLTKMNATVEVEATPQINGMIEKVKHLVCVEQI